MTAAPEYQSNHEATAALLLEAVISNFTIHPTRPNAVCHRLTGMVYPHLTQSLVTGRYFVTVNRRRLELGRVLFALRNNRWPYRLLRKDGDYTNYDPDNLIEQTKAELPNDGELSADGVSFFPENAVNPFRATMYLPATAYTPGAAAFIGYFPTLDVAIRIRAQVVELYGGDETFLSFRTAPKNVKEIVRRLWKKHGIKKR